MKRIIGAATLIAAQASLAAGVEQPISSASLFTQEPRPIREAPADGFPPKITQPEPKPEPPPKPPEPKPEPRPDPPKPTAPAGPKAENPRYLYVDYYRRWVFAAPRYVGEKRDGWFADIGGQLYIIKDEQASASRPVGGDN